MFRTVAVFIFTWMTLVSTIRGAQRVCLGSKGQAANAVDKIYDKNENNHNLYDRINTSLPLPTCTGDEPVEPNRCSVCALEHQKEWVLADCVINHAVNFVVEGNGKPLDFEKFDCAALNLSTTTVRPSTTTVSPPTATLSPPTTTPAWLIAGIIIIAGLIVLVIVVVVKKRKDIPSWMTTMRHKFSRVPTRDQENQNNETEMTDRPCNGSLP